MEFVTVEFADKPFAKALGTTAIFGTSGQLFTYSIFVQKGLGLHRIRVVERIDKTLSDPRGWTRGSIRFQRVADGASTFIIVADPDVTDKLCYPLKTEGKVSCCNGKYVVINVDRWKTGVPHWTGSQLTYRQMLINHEIGHRIGQWHRYCDGKGNKAPVMQQQTYGLQGCLANSWPLAHELPTKLWQLSSSIST